MNVAAATCVGVDSNSSVVMEQCDLGSKYRLQQGQLWGVATATGHSAPGELYTYYNLTSASETHWPAVPPSGWVLRVDELRKTTIILSSSTTNPAPRTATLKPWLNPWANGQKLPASPGCTMINTIGSAGPTLCKLPYCGAKKALHRFPISALVCVSCIILAQVVLKATVRAVPCWNRRVCSACSSSAV